MEGPTDAAEKPEEATRVSISEFDDALYASLASRSHSDQANALVNDVLALVEAHERATNARKNKRVKGQAALRTAAQGLLADLLQAQATKNSKGYVYRAMRPDGFTDEDVGYRVFKSLVSTLTTLGLLEHYRGFATWGQPFGAPVQQIRKATRLRASAQLLNLFERHAVRAADFHQHFLVPLPKNPLRLRATATRDRQGHKLSGKQLKYEPTTATQQMEGELRELNCFFDRFGLRGGIHRGFLRVFNNGDHPQFDWNMGGRLYSYGERNYQQMDSSDRLRMTINDEPVCEIDIRASYLTIFHALHRQSLDLTSDPYNIESLGEGARAVVKMWITASFGNNAPITRWPRDLSAKYREQNGEMLSRRYPASRVRQEVLSKFPLLARLGENVDGQPFGGWAQLMYLESQAMVATMVDLMSRGIPSLAVHDSIIVPVSRRTEATETLTKFYRAWGKATPVLVPHVPEQA